ncbi:unnamed protein product [Ambrosiozyma monospora]|uniref:Unnamed protein product n=1 Tax=Ambrosiozyma monospora TaxID=43982 RepID=A0A9W7DCH1_AMBMO|nr:unnamed protein product [Ambrosiozyma monospora]
MDKGLTIPVPQVSGIPQAIPQANPNSNANSFKPFPVPQVNRSSTIQELISLNDKQLQSNLEEQNSVNHHLSQLNWSSNYTAGFRHLIASLVKNRNELLQFQGFVDVIVKTYIDTFDSLKETEVNQAITANGGIGAGSSGVGGILFQLQEYLTSPQPTELKSSVQRDLVDPLKKFIVSYDKFIERTEKQFIQDLDQYTKTLNNLIAVSNDLNQMLYGISELKSTSIDITKSPVDLFVDGFVVNPEFEYLFADFEEFQSHLSSLNDEMPQESLSAGGVMSLGAKYHKSFRAKKLIRELKDTLDVGYSEVEKLINYLLDLKLIKFPSKSSIFQTYVFKIEDEMLPIQWTPLFNQVVNFAKQELTVDHDKIDSIIDEYKPKYETFLKLFFEFSKQRELIEKSLSQCFNNVERKEFERIQINFRITKKLIDFVKLVKPTDPELKFLKDFEKLDKMQSFYNCINTMSTHSYYIPNALNNQILNRLLINQMSSFPNFQSLILLFNNDLSLQLRVSQQQSDGDLLRKSLPYFIDAVIDEIEKSYSTEESRKLWLSNYNLDEVYSLKDNYLIKIMNDLDATRQNWKTKTDRFSQMTPEEENTKNKMFIDNFIQEVKETSNLVLLLKIFLIELNISLVPPISMALENYHDFVDLDDVANYLHEILNSLDRCSLSTLLRILAHLNKLKDAKFCENLIYQMDIPIIQFIYRPIVFQRSNDDKFLKINKFNAYLFISLLIRPESIKLIQDKLINLEKRFDKITSTNLANHQRQASLPGLPSIVTSDGVSRSRKGSNTSSGAATSSLSGGNTSQPGSAVTSPKQITLKQFKTRVKSSPAGSLQMSGSTLALPNGKLRHQRSRSGIDIMSLSRNASPVLAAVNKPPAGVGSGIESEQIENELKLDGLKI